MHTAELACSFFFLSRISACIKLEAAAPGLITSHNKPWIQPQPCHLRRKRCCPFVCINGKLLIPISIINRMKLLTWVWAAQSYPPSSPLWVLRKAIKNTILVTTEHCYFYSKRPILLIAFLCYSIECMYHMLGIFIGSWKGKLSKWYAHTHTLNHQGLCRSASAPGKSFEPELASNFEGAAHGCLLCLLACLCACQQHSHTTINHTIPISGMNP